MLLVSHGFTSGCYVVPEQTPRRAPKFLHLRRISSTILSTCPGLSSTVLLNFSPEVTCPWFSLVIVLYIRSLCQHLGVWWLKGKRSQDIKTSGFSGVGFSYECWQICFPLSSLRLVISAWMPCMPVVPHDIYSRMKIISHEKNSTGHSSQDSLGFLSSLFWLWFMLQLIETAIPFGTGCVWLCVCLYIPHFSMFSWNLFENLPLSKRMQLVQRFGKEDDRVVKATSCVLWEEMMPNDQLLAAYHFSLSNVPQIRQACLIYNYLS